MARCVISRRRNHSVGFGEKADVVICPRMVFISEPVSGEWFDSSSIRPLLT